MEPDNNTKSKTTPRCPQCNSDQFRRIVYGLPDCNGRRFAATGEIILGGCVVDPSSPNYKCSACGKEWK